ncbi:glycine rich domain-containing protein [Segatella albensis]|uniref:glycine rich domain-containing protein n=1 Tax=Segatella albensis TaxID=77768 RepID=UPI000469C7D2|nr:glycine rich domain-containing protein [Segatella albensis]
MQTFTAPVTGNYKLEVWGAQGGGWNTVPGGKGGYARGTYSMAKKQNIYIAVGAGGLDFTWNGGGREEDHRYSICGGGATSIQKSLLSDGQLYHYESVKETDVLIVAGGGGGSEWYYSISDKTTPTGGAGGGTNGENGFRGYGNSEPSAKGGTQTTGGKSTAIDASSGTQTIVDGSFGRGGYTLGGDGGGQGGGGWYGGGAADYAGGGGGGSGHIGTMCTNGSMQNGVREGNGYCVVTWQQLP